MTGIERNILREVLDSRIDFRHLFQTYGHARFADEDRNRPGLLAVIEASEARNHLREHLPVRRTVTGIAANRRGDVILRFGSLHEVLRAIAPATCSLSTEQEVG